MKTPSECIFHKYSTGRAMWALGNGLWERLKEWPSNVKSTRCTSLRTWTGIPAPPLRLDIPCMPVSPAPSRTETETLLGFDSFWFKQKNLSPIFRERPCLKRVDREWQSRPLNTCPHTHVLMLIQTHILHRYKLKNMVHTVSIMHAKRP